MPTGTDNGLHHPGDDVDVKPDSIYLEGVKY